MKKSLILLAGIMLAISSAQARLGETVDECQTRYGEPKRIALNDNKTGIATYGKNDLVITIHFLNGKADLIRYSQGQVTTIDLDLAKYLLKKNGRDKEWEQLTKTQIVLQDIQDLNAQHPRVELVDPIQWKSMDGLLSASFSVGKGTFEVRANTYGEKVRQGL